MKKITKKGLLIAVLLTIPLMLSAAETIFDSVVKGDEKSVISYIKGGGKVDARNDDDCTLLFTSVQNGRTGIVKILIDAKADVNLKQFHTHTTALVEAVKNNNIPIMKLLIDAGADVNLKDHTGMSPLMYAASEGFKDAAGILIDSLADVNLQNSYGMNALSWANQNHHADVAKMLADAGTGQNIFDAASAGNAGFVRAYVKNGGNVKVKNSDWRTPLMLAAQNGRAEVVKALIGAGADVNARERLFSSTALMCVVDYDHPDIVKTLLAAGADIDAKDPSGWTALAHAASLGYADEVNILIKAGADVNAVNNDGWTVISFAAWNHHNDIVKILRDSGAVN